MGVLQRLLALTAAIWHNDHTQSRSWGRLGGYRWRMRELGLPKRRAPRSVLVAVLISMAGCASVGATVKSADTTTPVTAETTVEVTAAPETAATTPVSTIGPTTDAAAPVRTLEAGSQGPDVMALQTRLNELHFDVKTPDGYFGPNTKLAIWAYQRLVIGLPSAAADGKVSPEMWATMQAPLVLPPRRPNATATHVEIDLPAEAMVLYVDNQVRLISHVSSGSGERWCAIPKNVPAYTGATTTTLPRGTRMRRMCGESITPGGVFSVYRKESGWYDIPLGTVYNPIYFNGGVALHGYDDVPFGPASHGCVRLPMHIAEYLPTLLHYHDDVFVWDGLQEPEVYGEQHPPLDVPDPTDTGPGVR